MYEPPLPSRELLSALQQTFQRHLHLPASLRRYKPPARIHSLSCSRVAGGPLSPRSAYSHTLQPLQTSAFGISVAQFQISPAPPPHHLCSSTPPRGPLGRLCLHRCGSLRVYTAQHLSDALKAHPVPHPSAYLARVLTVPSWLCGLVHTFCNLVMGERKSCYNPEATWLLALSPFLLQIFFYLNFLFLAFRTILGPKDRWPGTPSRRSWPRGAWP